MELGLDLAALIADTNLAKGGFDPNNDISQRSKKRSFDMMFKYRCNGDDGGDGCSLNLENPHGGNKLRVQHNHFDLEAQVPTILQCNRHLSLNMNRLQKELTGWPPIKCGRNDTTERANYGTRFRNVKPVKVKMEGVAIGRKTDLSPLNSYQDLHCDALSQIFPDQFCGSSSREEDENSQKETDYKVTYEYEEGDRMLAGDVPWEILVRSVKRLKILGDQSN